MNILCETIREYKKEAKTDDFLGKGMAYQVISFLLLL